MAEKNDWKVGNITHGGVLRIDHFPYFIMDNGFKGPTRFVWAVRELPDVYHMVNGCSIGKARDCQDNGRLGHWIGGQRGGINRVDSIGA